ncbi:MAG: ABC transporter ATP-binding protein [Candidatus Dormibacteraceae bacterium]
MTDHVCELVGVGKSYDGHAVISDIDLAVMKGEMLAITGKSGSGKSTLLNIIGLLETADHGDLRLFGEPGPRVRSANATRMLRFRLGYLFQNFALIDGESVDNNLRIAQAYTKRSRSGRQEARESALQAVGLSNSGGQKVYQLSGGEQQRVAIARLMLKPCDLVLADEPTGSLDTTNGDLVLAMLRELNAGGKTMIIVTHDDRVAAECDRVIALPDPRSAIAPSEPGDKQ